ncbi:MAG: cation transporter [Lentisphaerae bacterium]|nr:cation transporter [Lentisphaerota bacterium]
MLTSLILNLTVPGINGTTLSARQRNRCGIVSGITGIVCNIILAVTKVALAVITGSIAMAADAVNNLSDAGSGIITVAGFRLSSQPPDAEHPFGHGRSEYVAALIVALLIFCLGMNFLKDSVISVFHPSQITCSNTVIIIFAATVLVKCWLFFFYRKIGRLINSDVIKAAALDSLSDCLGTLLVIGALISSRYTAFPLDGTAGIVIAGMILWAGGNILKETVNKLLGTPPDSELVEKIRQAILESPGIDGVHDIIIHNYGENSYYATAHAEISCDGDRFSAHDILENAEIAVAGKLPVHLLLHGDPYNTANPEVILWRGRMENTVAGFDSNLKLYDFRLDKDENGNVCELAFHLLIPHKYGMSSKEIKEELRNRMSVYNPDIQLDILFLKSFI